jgi:outer membrane protein assembly factor BamB
MTLTIFCSNSHLILDAPACPVCGWTRPVAGALGEPAWEHPLELNTELGGPGRHVFARMASAQGIAILPLQAGSLVGIALSNGQLAWRVQLETGLRTRAVLPYGNRLLVPLSDERQFTEAEHGLLVTIAPASGKLATLWEAETPMLSLPVLKGDRLYLRTSRPELVALRLGQKVGVAWRAGMNSAGAMLQPCVSGSHVFISDGEAMQGKAYLNVYEVESGRLVDRLVTEGILSQPMLTLDNVIIFQDGHKQLVGLDAASLEILWRKPLERIYTPPCAGSSSVLVVVRGAAEKQAPGYYSLLSIHPHSGEILWNTPVPARTIIPPVEAQGQIYLGSEDGQIFCLHAGNGDLLWKYTLGGEEDPLRTELLLAEGLLIAGTYSGKVAALRVSAAPETVESPETYIQNGDFESAAAVYALKGNFRKAGKIYADQANDPCKAFGIYEHAEMYQDAGNLARTLEMWDEAQRYFQLAGNKKAEAEMALRRGDELTAARLIEQAGDLPQAARLFEQAGDFTKARELYLQLGDGDAIMRVNKDVPLSLPEIEVLVNIGKVSEAAEEAWKAGFLRMAVDLFQKAGLSERELQVLPRLFEKEPENWVLERIIELARKAGRFVEEAQACERLGNPRKTAAAYQRAALQAEQIRPCNQESIASLYEIAVKYYADGGLKSKEKECWAKVVTYRQLPIITIESLPRKAFIEEEFNLLVLVVKNAGEGQAHNVHVSVGGSRFETDERTSFLQLDNLAEGEAEQKQVYIRPLKGQVGDTVPLQVEWGWQALNGQKYSQSISVPVPVRRKDESKPGAQVMNIGTFIQGDQFSGDKVAEGGEKQVGDSIKIDRNTGISASSGKERLDIRSGSGDNAQHLCPICHSLVEPDAKFCSACQNPLPPLPRRRK